MKPVVETNHRRRRYAVRHVTTYSYAEEVTSSYGRACLRLRDTAFQHVAGRHIQISPQPEAFTEHVDLFGNFSHYFEIHQPHRRLVVAKTSEVTVERPPVDVAALDIWTVAEAAACAASMAQGEDRTVRTAYLLPSRQIELSTTVREYARSIVAPGSPLGSALADLVSAIHADFRYTKGVTSVDTTLPELLELRAGVCQDFAHLAIGCLRVLGIPARYVSGYLETQPPPGKPKLQGADATHAWASARLPDGDWLDLDPTNDCLADARYVVTGWGRDYRDVAPMKGVIFTEGATSSLDVAVDVTRLPDAADPCHPKSTPAPQSR